MGCCLWKGRECGSRRVVAACCVFPAASLPVFKALTLPFLTPPAHFPLFQMFFVAECHKMLLWAEIQVCKHCHNVTV